MGTTCRDSATMATIATISLLRPALVLSVSMGLPLLLGLPTQRAVAFLFRPAAFESSVVVSFATNQLAARQEEAPRLRPRHQL